MQDSTAYSRYPFNTDKKKWWYCITAKKLGEQLSKELDEQLPDQLAGLVGESTLKTSSKRKRKQKKKNQANKVTTQDNVCNLSLVNVEEVSGLT